MPLALITTMPSLLRPRLSARAWEVCWNTTTTADAQPDRDRELHHHQRGARQARAGYPAGVGAQRSHGPKARKQQRRISARQKTRHRRQRRQPQQQRPVGEIIERDRPGRKPVEGGKQDFGEREREQERDQGGQDRFPQELRDQLPAACAHHLAQADLLRPHHRPRGGEIGEIEAGDQKDQDPDRGEAIDHGPASRRRHAAILVGGKMRVAEKRQPRLQYLASLEVDIGKLLGIDAAVDQGGFSLANTVFSSAPGARST